MYSVKGYNLVEELCDPDLYPMLCIDDIGAENLSQNSYGNHMSVINEVIERRHANSVPTFGTTNLNNFKGKEGYDDRMVRRIQDLFNIRVVNPQPCTKAN